MSMSAVTTKRKPTTSQRRAIETINKWVAVVAGAGSGKTAVLIARCLNVLKGNPSNLNHLLAITFTEKAAGELLSRIRKHIPSSDYHLLSHAWIGTFHSICARILRNNAPMISLDPSFSILDENAYHLLSQQVIYECFISLLEKKDHHALFMVEELDFKSAVAILKHLLEFRWHANRALEYCSKSNEREQKLHKATTHCYKEVERAVLDALLRQGSLDFQELEIKTVELLKNHPNIRKIYQRRFKHILVDEYQDTSDIQSELVFLLADPKVNHLAIVGDPRQSIYRFRGANVHCFEEAIRKIKEAGGDIIHMDENFRSEAAIVSLTNRTFDHLWSEMGADTLTPMKTARQDIHKGAAVDALLFKAPDTKITTPLLRSHEAIGLANHIKSLVDGGRFNFSDIACLFKAMTNLTNYEMAFKKIGVPYRVFGGRGLLERQEIKDVIHALSFAANSSDHVALLGLLRSPLIGLSDDDCAKLAGHQGKDLPERALKDSRTSLLRFLTSAALSLLPSEIIKRVIDLTAYDIICQMLDPSGGMQANIERLISLAKSLEKEGPTTLGSFVTFISELKEKSARLGDPPALGFGGDAVSLMTVHTAKGLEFPVVIIPDLLREVPPQNQPYKFLRKEGLGFKLKDANHPFADRTETERFEHLSDIDAQEEQEEYKRLLYVALTRARDLLVLPLHHHLKIKARWHEWLLNSIDNSSSKITKKWEISQQKHPDLRKLKNINAEDILSQAPVINEFHLKKKSGNIFTVTELESYERCPHEYYLKYILGLPACEILPSSDRLPANIRGSIVHAVLQKYESLSKTNITNLITAECYAASIIPDKKILQDLKKPLNIFAQSKLAENINSGKRELRFDWKFKGAVITGTIDWLRSLKNGFEIVDFKTDLIEAKTVKARAKEYDLQLITYALAAKAATKKHIASTTLYFLEPDVIHTDSMNERREKNGLQRIANIIGQIGKENFRPQMSKPRCFKCPYYMNKMCKAL